ncbi:hypothetical protein Taro_032136 [Colocasia esculenta]|uniref:Uncharacterized protein n=1 Tax=Colocasia esculenta TaxID=4460 RepID=A0A843VQM0_COLES|nr:hypothetical protein [Colocasia esculenta]
MSTAASPECLLCRRAKRRDTEWSVMERSEMKHSGVECSGSRLKSRRQGQAAEAAGSAWSSGDLDVLEMLPHAEQAMKDAADGTLVCDGGADQRPGPGWLASRPALDLGTAGGVRPDGLQRRRSWGSAMPAEGLADGAQGSWKRRPGRSDLAARCAELEVLGAERLRRCRPRRGAAVLLGDAEELCWHRWHADLVELVQGDAALAICRLGQMKWRGLLCWRSWYAERDETWPIIIASDLEEGQEKKLIEVLKIHRNFFQVHDKVWLFNSRLSMFSEKLKSRWDGPYIVVRSYDNGAVIILDPKNRQSLTVNGRRSSSRSCWKRLELGRFGCAGDAPACRAGDEGCGWCCADGALVCDGGADQWPGPGWLASRLALYLGAAGSVLPDGL